MTHIICSIFIIIQFSALISSTEEPSGRRVLYVSVNYEPKIGSEDQASIYEYTFMAAIVVYKAMKKSAEVTEKIIKYDVDKGTGQLACGGAIIHQDWVLTVARCFDVKYKLQMYEIFAGVVDLTNQGGDQIRHIQYVLKHPRYESSSDEYNIAMIKVSSSFKTTTHVSPGFLPVKPLSISGTESCHILGFVREEVGLDNTEQAVDRLTKVQLHVIDAKECMDVLKIRHETPTFRLSQLNYCLMQIEDNRHNASQGACKGDVGGPCVCGFKIQGLVAHATTKTCLTQGYPTTIIDVGQHLNWIRASILQLNIIARSQAVQRTSIRFLTIKIIATVLLMLKQYKC